MTNDTEYDRTKEYLKGKLPMYLRSKNISINSHFKCFNPAHHDTEQSMHYDKKSHTVQCSKCNAHYDIFDIVGIEYKLSTFEQCFNRVHEMYIGPVPDDMQGFHEALVNDNHQSPQQFMRAPQQPLIASAQHTNYQARTPHQFLNASNLEQFEAQNKVDVNAQRQYSTSFGPQQSKGVHQMISINQSGDVTSVQSNMSQLQAPKPQPVYAKQKNAQDLYLNAGITTISISAEEAKQISGVNRLDQLPPSIAAAVRASDQAKRKQLQERRNNLKQEQAIAEQALGSVEFAPHELANNNLGVTTPVVTAPTTEHIVVNGGTISTTTLPMSAASGGAEQVTIHNKDGNAAGQGNVPPFFERVKNSSPDKRSFPALPQALTNSQPQFKEQGTPNFFASSQQGTAGISGGTAGMANAGHNGRSADGDKPSSAFNNPVFTAPVSSEPIAQGREATRATLHPIHSNDDKSMSAQIDKMYNKVWADHDKSRRQKREAAAQAAAENVQRRLREEEYSRQIQQRQYQNQLQEANLASAAAQLESEYSPYLSPAQNISEFEHAKAQRQAEAQAINEAQMVSGNVEHYLPPSLKNMTGPNGGADDAAHNSRTSHAGHDPHTSGVTTYTTHGSGQADNSLRDTAPAHSIVTGSLQQERKPRAQNSSLSGMSTEIIGMMEQINGTSNGSMNNGNSHQGKSEVPTTKTTSTSHSWQQVFGDAELPLLNPTAPSTLINGRSYNFEQMDEKALRNSIERNLASDTARISAENTQDQYAFFTAAKSRPEQPSTHIYGSAVTPAKSEELPQPRPSASDPYNTAKRPEGDGGSIATADTNITGAHAASLRGQSQSRHDQDAEVATFIQRSAGVQRTPSGAIVGSTAEIHSTPSIAEQLRKELEKTQRRTEQNTRISGKISKVEESNRDEEISTRISKSDRNTPPAPETLPPIDMSNPYSTTIMSGKMKDRFMPEASGKVSSNGSKKPVHRGPKIDFSNSKLGQDSTVTTATNHIAQIDLTNWDRDRVSSLNEQTNKPADRTSTPLNFFARAQDAEGVLRNTILVEDMDDFEQKSNDLAQRQRKQLDNEGSVSIIQPHNAQRERLESILSILESEPNSSHEGSILSNEKLEELNELATLPSMLEKKSELEAMGIFTHKPSSKRSHAKDHLESTEDLNEALEKTAAAISAAAAIKAASVSLDKDLAELGLGELTHASQSELAERAQHEDLERKAVTQLKQSLDSVDLILDAPADKQRNKLEELDDLQVRPEDRLPPLKLTPEEKEKALKLGIQILQAEDLLDNPELLKKHFKDFKGSQQASESEHDESLQTLQELKAAQQASAKDASAEPAETATAPQASGKEPAPAHDQAQEPIAAAPATPESAPAPQAAAAQTTAATQVAPESAGESAPAAPVATVAQAAVPASTVAQAQLNMAMPPVMPMGTMAQPNMPVMMSQGGMMQVAPIPSMGMPMMPVPPVASANPVMAAPATPAAAIPEPAPLVTYTQPNVVAQAMAQAAVQTQVGGQAAGQAQATSPTAAQVVGSNTETAPAPAAPAAEPMAAVPAQATGTTTTTNAPAEAAQAQDQAAASSAVTDPLKLGQEYWVKNHGLSAEIVERYALSYVPQLPVGTQMWSAGIIPLSEGCQQVLNSQTGQSFFMGDHAPCFNLDVFTQSLEGLNHALFIVASALDVLSLESLGAHAVALVRPDNADQLLEFLQENMQSTLPFYVALDKSSAWAEAGERLSWGFNTLQQPFKLIDLAAPYSSINQALLQNRSNLLNKLQNPEVLNSLVILPEAAAQEAAAANASANQLNKIQLLEVFAPMKDSGFILSTESLAKLQLANVLYTMTTTNVAISRLILSSIMLNQAPILFAGSKMQWQMLCNRLASLPVGGVLTSNNSNTVVVGSPQETNPSDPAPGIAPQPCNARLIELPLEFDTKSLLITITQAVMTARNTLPNFASLRLMLDTYSFEPRFCAALAPLLAELALNLNLPIMVWCSNEQRNFFEGQSVQTIEMSKSLDNEIIFKTFDQNCHLQTFRSIQH